MPTLIVNPPSTYILLFTTAAPPGRTLPPALPGHGSVPTTVSVSLIGSYWRTALEAVAAPAAEPPTAKMYWLAPTVSTAATMLFTWLSLNTADLVVQVPATGLYSAGFSRSLPAASEVRPPRT